VINSGVVMQNPDGSLEAVSPDEAEKLLAAMSPEVRALYEQVGLTGIAGKRRARWIVSGSP